MKTSTIITWVIVIAIIIFGGWYLFSSKGTPAVAPTADNSAPTATTPTAPVAATPSPETTPPAQNAPMIPAASTPVIKVSSSTTLGSYLASSSNGMTLYTYSKDSKDVSNCTGDCTTNWPPYTTTAKGPYVAVGGVSGTISSFTRADGTKQLTYNGMPLYFWISDTNPGDTTGDGIGGFSVAKP